MTDVPPDPGLPPASGTFDDDALADALAAQVASYTSPITVIPQTPDVAVEPAAAEPVPEVAPEPVAPEYVAPEYVAPEYVAPEYVAPEYVAPEYVTPEYVTPAVEYPPTEAADASPATTLDAIQRLEEELRRRGLGEPDSQPAEYMAEPEIPDYAVPAAVIPEFPEPDYGEPAREAEYPVPAYEDPAPVEPPPGAFSPSGYPMPTDLAPPSAEFASHADIAPPPEADVPVDDRPAWEPALDHPAAGHVFPTPYAPFGSATEDPESAAPDVDDVPPRPLPGADQLPVYVPPAYIPPATIPPAAEAEPFAEFDDITAYAPSAPLADQTAPVFVAEPAPQPTMGEPVFAEPIDAEPIDAEPIDAEPVDGDTLVTAPPAEWAGAPAPDFSPPPLVEPPAAGEPASTPPAPSLPDAAFSTMPATREQVADLPPPIGLQPAPIPPYDPVVEAAAAAAVAAAQATIAPAVPTPPPIPEATEPAELDENDDAVDDIDRVAGDSAAASTPLIAPAVAAPPSEPIATQRLSPGAPALVDERPESHPVFVIETAGVEPTALDLRAGRAARLFWLWFAANGSVVTLAVGAVLFTLGMSLRQTIVATLAGVALSFLPLGLGTLAGKWSGQPTMVISRATFGHLGNVLPAIVAVLSRVFWGGVMLWLLATSIARVLVTAGLDAGLGVDIWTYVSLVAGFVIVTVVALFGYGFVARLQLITSIVSGLLIVGVIVLTYPQLDLDRALATGDGSWVLVVSGAVIVFSVVGLAWVHTSSDLARYQRVEGSGAQSMLWATFGATLPPFLLISWGAMLSASDPDLARGLASAPLETIAHLLPLWYPAPLLVAAAVGLLSGAVLTIYSGGFALLALAPKLRRSVGTVIASVLAVAAAAGFVLLSADANSIVRDVATTLAVPVAAWAGIYAAEMMIRTRRFHTPSLLRSGGVYPQVRIVNVLLFLVLTVVGFGFSSATLNGLTWQGFLFPILGVKADDPWATSDVGVLVALVGAVVLTLVTGFPAIRRQEEERPVTRTGANGIIITSTTPYQKPATGAITLTPPVAPPAAPPQAPPPPAQPPLLPEPPS
jgi:purine-cytosine permease-like protein